MRIYFVTSNKYKFNEVERVLGTGLIMKKLDVPEIQAIEVKDVVEDKAKRAYEILKKPLIVEDTGLYIKSLNDFPGAFARWFFDTVGNERLCKMLDNFKDRSAYSETCICFYDGKRSMVFSGRGYGEIVKKPRGSEGWGYDPIFQPRGCTKTFGEMDMDQKNAISMRAKAARKLKQALRSGKM
jgi:non-canonical purine NTP pyrophosphatase (RdgB/HAM1 family)